LPGLRDMKEPHDHVKLLVIPYNLGSIPLWDSGLELSIKVFIIGPENIRTSITRSCKGFAMTCYHSLCLYITSAIFPYQVVFILSFIEFSSSLKPYLFSVSLNSKPMSQDVSRILRNSSYALFRCRVQASNETSLYQSTAAPSLLTVKSLRPQCMCMIRH
jgi:hypothetical protein